MEYWLEKELDVTFEQAYEHTIKALQKHGFGVLTEIDVQATMKKKVDADMDKYVILGACNPPLAYKALSAEQRIGLLLPCNMIVYEESSHVYVAAIRPVIAMQMVNNTELATIATQVENKLAGVMEEL